MFRPLRTSRVTVLRRRCDRGAGSLSGPARGITRDNRPRGRGARANDRDSDGLAGSGGRAMAHVTAAIALHRNGGCLCSSRSCLSRRVSQKVLRGCGECRGSSIGPQVIHRSAVTTLATPRVADRRRELGFGSEAPSGSGGWCHRSRRRRRPSRQRRRGSPSPPSSPAPPRPSRTYVRSAHRQADLSPLPQARA